jgi:hypothetical protein
MLLDHPPQAVVSSVQDDDFDTPFSECLGFREVEQLSLLPPTTSAGAPSFFRAASTGGRSSSGASQTVGKAPICSGVFESEYIKTEAHSVEPAYC